MAMVPNGKERVPKISTGWVGRTNFTDRQADRRNGDYSERSNWAARLIDVSGRRPLYVTLRECRVIVDRGSALYSCSEARRYAGNDTVNPSCRAQLTLGWGRVLPRSVSRQPRTNQHVSRQQLGGRGIRASSRPRPSLVSPGRGQNWAPVPRKPRIKIGTRGTVDSSPLT